MLSIFDTFMSKFFLMRRKYRFEATGKDPISVCLAGHFDSGKSTLAGQLLYQLGGMSHREFQKLQQEATKAGDMSKVFSFFLDKTKGNPEISFLL